MTIQGIKLWIMDIKSINLVQFILLNQDKFIVKGTYMSNISHAVLSNTTDDTTAIYTVPGDLYNAAGLVYGDKAVLHVIQHHDGKLLHFEFYLEELDTDNLHDNTSNVITLSKENPKKMKIIKPPTSPNPLENVG